MVRLPSAISDVLKTDAKGDFSTKELSFCLDLLC